MRMDLLELVFYLFVHMKVETCEQDRSAAESLKYQSSISSGGHRGASPVTTTPPQHTHPLPGDQYLGEGLHFRASNGRSHWSGG